MGLDDPDRQAGLLLFATAYQRHPYRLPVIGEIEIYNQLTQEQVMQYYKSRYVPNNLTFIVVGDVDGEKVHEQLATFSKVTRRKRLASEHPRQLGGRRRKWPSRIRDDCTARSLAHSEIKNRMLSRLLSGNF